MDPGELRRISILAELPDERLEELARHGRELTLEARRVPLPRRRGGHVPVPAARGRARDDALGRRRRATAAPPRARRLPRCDLPRHRRGLRRLDALGRREPPLSARARGVPGTARLGTGGIHRRHGRLRSRDHELTRPSSATATGCCRSARSRRGSHTSSTTPRQPHSVVLRSCGLPSATPSPPCHSSPPAGLTRTGCRGCAR